MYFTLSQLAQVLQSSNNALKHHGICTRKWKNKSKEKSSASSQNSLLHNPSSRHATESPTNTERPGEGEGDRAEDTIPPKKQKKVGIHFGKATPGYVHA